MDQSQGQKIEFEYSDSITEEMAQKYLEQYFTFLNPKKLQTFFEVL